ncbi:mucin-4-like, partial [Lemur catta]|uniref:mucin-4-like n=1 Tax=Lemur catta TaxID=9447 RepID=UPI001E26BDB6
MRGVPWVLLSCLCCCLLWPGVPGNSTTVTTPLTSSEYSPKKSTSQETTHSSETTTSSPSSVSNIPRTTSEVHRTSTSTDTTLENTGETSTTERGRLTSLTLEISMTMAQETPSKTSSRISTQETMEFSQNSQTQSMETTRESQASTLTQVTTSTLSSSSNGHTLTETISQDTSHSSKTTTSSTSVINNTTLMTSEVLKTTNSADLTLKTTSTSVTGSIMAYPSAVSLTDAPEGQSTATSSRTPTQEMPESSQSHQTQSTDTTREREASTCPQVTIANPPSTQYGHHLTGTISSTIAHIGHTQATQTAQESQTMRLVSPVTDTIKKVTTTASSFIPSGYSPSGSVPQDASTPGKVTTFTPAPSGDGHTTQATTTGLWAASTSPDISLERLGGTSLSVTGTIPQVTTVVSTAGGPGGQLTLPSASTSPDVTPAITQAHQTQSTETSGEAQTSKQASSISHTISAGTATPSSSMASDRTTSGSVSSETPTSGGFSSFSPTPSSDSQTTQGTTEFLSTSTSHDTSPGDEGMVSVIVPSTFSTTSKVSISEKLTEQSSTTSSGTSLQEMSAIPYMPQTWSMGTSGGSETMGSGSSQVTDISSTVTSPPLLSSPNGLTSPQTETHTLSPSDSSKTLISTPFSESHQSHTIMPTLSPGTMGGPPGVGSTTLRAVASHSPSTVLSTTEEVLTSSTSSVTQENMTTVVIPPVHSGSISLTNTTQVPTSSVGISSTPSFHHPATTQRVVSTTSPKMRSSSVIPPNTPSSAASSTLTVAGESTSHPLSRTSPVTSSETSTSQPMTADAFTHTHIPTFAVSPSSHADPATELQSTATKPVATQATATDISEAVARTTTFDISATAGPTRQSMPTPLFSTISAQESSTAFPIGHTQATQTTQESQTMRLVSPVTDTIKKVTTTASSFIPSGYSPSGSVPQDASTTGEVTTFTPAPSGDGHTTQATTTGLWAASTSPDISLESSGGTSPFVTGTIPQVTTVVSALGGPGGQLTLPSASTSPDVTPAITQAHQTQSTETSGEAQTSKQASSISHTISAGTATPSSSMASDRTTSGSVSSETPTSGRFSSFSPTPSSDSQTTQGTTEFLSTSTSHDTSPGDEGMVSVIVPSTFSTTSKVSISEKLTEQSSTTSSGTSLQEMSAIPYMPQTWSMGTSGGSETMGSGSSQVTDISSTVTSPPLLSSPNGLTSPQTETHTLSPSDSSKTLISTPFSESHQSHTIMPTLSPGTMGGPPGVGSTTLRAVASHSPSTVLSTTEEVLTSSTSSVTQENMTTVVIPPVHSGSISLTNTTQVPTSSVGISSTPSFHHPATTQRVVSTTSPKMRSSSVIPPNTPRSAASSTLTVAGESTSHPLSRTSPVTSSETSTSQPMTADAFTHTHIPTFAVSPSSHADPATELQSTATKPVATQATATDISEAVARTTTFDISATAGPTRQSMPTPLFSTISAQESSTAFPIGHTQATQTTQESQTMRLVSPVTDTIKKVTTTASSFIPSGYSPSGSVPQDASTTGEVTTFTPAPSGDGHTTQATTTGLWAASTSPDISLESSGGTSPFVTGTIPQVTTVVSALGGPGGQLTLPSASTSPDVTPAITQAHQTQSTETSGEAQTSKQASSISHTISAGTATPSSSMASDRTTSGSVSSETPTSGRFSSFSPTPSSDSQTTQGTTEFLSTSTSHDTSPGDEGMVSVIVPSTFSTTSKVSISEKLTEQSSTTSSGTSLQEMSAIPHMPQTCSMGTSGGSETMSSGSSQVTDTFSTVTSPPLLSTSNGLTSPQTETHTLSPSDSSKTLISTPFSESHQSHTIMPTLSPGTMGGPPGVGSTTLRAVASHSPSTVLSTTEEVLTSSTSSVTQENMTTVIIPPVHSGSISLTNATQVPTSSVGISSTPSFHHPATTQRVVSTTSPKMRSSSVIPPNTLSSAASSTLTVAGESTSHPLSRTSPVTSSETSTSQPMTADAFTHTHIPTFAVSPSSHADPATELQSTATKPVATQATATDISEAVTRTTTFDISATAG